MTGQVVHPVVPPEQLFVDDERRHAEDPAAQSFVGELAQSALDRRVRNALCEPRGVEPQLADDLDQHVGIAQSTPLPPARVGQPDRQLQTLRLFLAEQVRRAQRIE